MTDFTPHTPLEPGDREAQAAPRVSGPGRVLVVVYAILALSATARSLVQIATRFDRAPLAYSLSAVAAVVYIVATVALARHHRPGWHRVAVITIGFELAGVLIVGALTTWEPTLFLSNTGDGRVESTVWSGFGMGYGFVPLVLPVLGLWWLARHRPGRADAGASRGDTDAAGGRAAGTER